MQEVWSDVFRKIKILHSCENTLLYYDNFRICASSGKLRFGPWLEIHCTWVWQYDCRVLFIFLQEQYVGQ